MVSDIDNPYDFKIETGPDGLHFEGMKRIGDQVYIKGIRQGEDVEGGPVWELHRYDMSTPLQPVHYTEATIEVPEPFLSEYYYGDVEAPREKTAEDDEEPVQEEGGETVSMVYYDPFSWKVLDDGTVAVYSYYHEYYYYYEKEPDQEQLVKRIDLIRWTGKDSLETRSVSLPSTYYLQELMGSWDGIIASNHAYGSGNSIVKVTFENTEPTVTTAINVKGRLVGVSDDLTHVYTALDYWMEDGSHNTMNVYDISSGSAVYLMGVELEGPIGTVDFQGDRMVVVSQDHYWYYDHRYAEEEIVYDDGEIAVGSGGSESGSSDEPEASKGEKEEEEEYVPEHTTRIHILGIEDNVFETRRTYTLDGIFHSSSISEDLILMQSGYSVIGVDIGGSGISERGPFTLPGTVIGGDLKDEKMVVAMGLFGLEIIEI
jgi:hypothetical protein